MVSPGSVHTSFFTLLSADRNVSFSLLADGISGQSSLWDRTPVLLIALAFP